jgi:hypothetical protein
MKAKLNSKRQQSTHKFKKYYKHKSNSSSKNIVLTMYLNPNASVPSKPPSKLNKAAAAFTPSSYTAGIPPSQASAGGLSSSAVPRLQSPTPAGYSRVQSPLPHVTSPAYTWNMEMPSQGYAQPFFPIDQTAPHDAAAPTQAHRWGMGMPPQGYAQPFSTTDHMAPHDAAAPTQAHHWSMGMPNKGPPIEPEDSTAQMAPNAIVLPSPPSLEGLPPEIRAFLEHHQQMAQQMAQMINRQNGRIDRQNERIDRQTECIDRQTECIDRQTECIDELKDDVRHMMNAVVDYEYDITDRDATNHIREDVKKTFENRYPPKTPGGTARKRVKLSDLTEKELRKRKDLGSPEGPHWSVSHSIEYDSS